MHCLRVFVYSAVAIGTAVMLATAPHAGTESPRLFDFDIDAKPLGIALRDFGKVTDIELFYDGAIAQGRQSTKLKGRFSAMAGLRIMLRGTGHVARDTGIANTVTLAELPAVTGLRSSFAAYQPYFALLQARVRESLCPGERSPTNAAEVRFRFWIDQSGTINRAEVLGESGPADAALVRRIQGASVGKRPPVSLPQPVTMVVYPPSKGEALGCRGLGETHR